MSEKSPEQPEREEEDRLAHAYHTMARRVHEALQHAGTGAEALTRALAAAKDKAVDLGELTREEAERLGDYLRRDIEEARRYLATSEAELADWFRIDLGLIEQGLLDFFSRAADPTEVELLRLQEQALEASIYRTGEIAGPGTLECVGCGELLHFERAGRIPPCPRCHGTEFVRKGR